MSSQVVAPNTEASILARIVKQSDGLTPEAAKYLLSFKLPQSDVDRVNELSAKARDESLTPAERQELESYLHIDTLLSTMRSKAHRLLKIVPAA